MDTVAPVAAYDITLGLHHVPGDDSNHISGHRGGNKMFTRHCKGKGWANVTGRDCWQKAATADLVQLRNLVGHTDSKTE